MAERVAAGRRQRAGRTGSQGHWAACPSSPASAPPELHGRAWLNTGGRAFSVRDFRGRFLLLDFWTFCCVNCLHVLDELRPLEQRYADVLVTVGVHSPKFEHEADPQALAAAVQRYEVGHPVLDDPDLTTWQAYTARAWPTLVLVDPEGYVVAHHAGEGHAHALDALLAELVAEHDLRTLRRGESPYAPPDPEPGELRFPASVVELADGGLLVADTGHHRLVELDADGETVRRSIGAGRRGLVDGSPDEATFSEPNGLALLPAEVAALAGYDVVVADTVNHALRGVRLSDGRVRTLAGTGEQEVSGDGTARLSSPWDVAWWRDRVWVAMAGIHQLWTNDPSTGDVSVAAGTSNEGLVDGPAREAWLAQPSRLAPGADQLWFADAETSAVRVLTIAGDVRTAVGTGLFDFGFVDGEAGQALLQHPLGVTVLPDRTVTVCDTYNGAVRRYDPATGALGTLATGLAEPSAAVVVGEHLLVVESAAHRLTRLPLGATAAAGGSARRTQRPVTEVAAGDVELQVVFDPAPGQQVDDRFGPATQVVVEATPPQLVRAGDGRGTGLARTLTLDRHVGDGVLHVAARAASCDVGGGAGAACHLHQQDWGVPVRITSDGVRRLTLVLSARSGD